MMRVQCFYEAENEGRPSVLQRKRVRTKACFCEPQSSSSIRYISVGQKGGKIGRFQHIQDKDYFACQARVSAGITGNEGLTPLRALGTKTPSKCSHV